MTARALPLLLVLAAGCAGRSTHAGGSGGSAGDGGAAAGTGGTAAGAGGSAGSGGASAGRTGEDACAPLGTDPTRAPARKGCYVFDDGHWVRLLCGECELPIENPSDEPLVVSILLTATLGNEELSFTESPSIVVTFDDLDGRFFDTWSQQPGNGTDFMVSHDDVRTAVALHAPSVALAPVTLHPCEARYSEARVTGPDPVSVLLNVDTTTPEGVVTEWGSVCVPATPPPRP